MKRESTRKFRKALARTKDIGEEIAAIHADDVDKQARFPEEAVSALKAESLLSAYVPEDYGGLGLSVAELGELCFELAHHCSSTAMVFAMHHMMVANIVNHHGNQSYYLDYMRAISEKQLLIASGHSEIGTGGDVSISKCAVEPKDEGFNIFKQAPKISYGERADAILLSARRSPDSNERDQVQLLLNREDYSLEKISDWDSMGMRGTCSSGFNLRGSGMNAQIFEAQCSDMNKMTLAPITHILWGYLWWGIADQAFKKALAVAKQQHKTNPGIYQVSRTRISEINNRLFALENSVCQIADEYDAKLENLSVEQFNDIRFPLKINDLKIFASEQAIEVVTKSLIVCGIGGYLNNTEISLARYIRDIYSAPIMINNDRLIGNNGVFQLSE